MMDNRKTPAVILRSAIVAAALATTLLGSGCAARLPCLEYQPQMVTRTVTMRGHGYMQVRQEAMVCTVRARALEEHALGN